MLIAIKAPTSTSPGHCELLTAELGLHLHRRAQNGKIPASPTHCLAFSITCAAVTRRGHFADFVSIRPLRSMSQDIRGSFTVWVGLDTTECILLPTTQL